MLRVALRIGFALSSCAPYVAAAETITGNVVAIADGDTLTVLDRSKRQHKIRLAEIDAPESKQPFGTKSKQSLAELCFNKSAAVETRENDRYGRAIGYVMCEGVDANAEQVRRGMAWVFVRYAKRPSALYDFEADARLRRLGLWADEKPIAPWEWRAQQRLKQAH